MTAAALFGLAACIAIGGAIYQWIRGKSLYRRALRAERRFDLLQQLAPFLTASALESTGATCARILERLNALVPSETLLCYYTRDGRLVLGAKAGDGYAGFLRDGSAYEGDSIIDWTRDRAKIAVAGPGATDIPADVEAVDLTREPDGREVGPAAGSRDRVWALAAPLVRGRGYGLHPEVLGVVYLERPRAQPFADEDLRTISTVARLAADALARAVFADAVRRDSQVDGLTGLMTPTAFRKRLRDEVAARRDVALFFIDSDRFKLFNDTYGHAAGDKLLRELAGIFQESARKGIGFAGRNGGDEFCIAMLDRTKDAAVVVAEQIRATIDGVDFVASLGLARDFGIKVTVSIGVAHYPVDVASDVTAPADRLLEVADEQMYEAKRAGRNHVEFLRLRAQLKRVIFPGEGPIPRI
jgi:diguanylate cyclase (GGDEF)-like protein